MNINGSNPLEGKDLYGKVQDVKKNQGAETKNDAQKTDASGDKISLSGKSKEISELKGLIEQLPEIRADKVEALKKTIDSGSYNFDSLKIAEKILEEI